MFPNRQLLALVALLSSVTAPATPTSTLSAAIPAGAAPLLSNCESICKLMESTIPDSPDPNSSLTLFLSLCKDTGRDDCGSVQQQFSVDYIPAGGDGRSFKCICGRGGPAGESTTSATTFTPTAWATTSPSPSTSALELPIATTSSADGTSATVARLSSLTASSSVPTATPNPNIKTTTPSIAATSIPTTVSILPPTTKTSSTVVNTELAESDRTLKDEPRAGTIAGVVIGLFATLAIVAGGAFLIRRRRIQKMNKKLVDNIVGHNGLHRPNQNMT